MENVALASINNFASAHSQCQQDLERKVSELEKENERLRETLESTIKDSTSILNTLLDFCGKKKLLTSREIKEFASQSAKNLLAATVTERPLLLNAYIKKLITVIKSGWGLDPAPKVMGASEKRAWLLIDRLAETGKTILTTKEAQLLINGNESKSVNREQTIRAMKKATKINHTIELEKVPNDPKNKLRLILSENTAPDSETVNIGLRHKVRRKNKSKGVMYDPD